MNKFLKSYWVLLSFLFVISTSFYFNKAKEKDTKALVKIVFINKVKDKKIVLNDSVYTNPFNEKYAITKLRYYVTNIELQGNNVLYKEDNSYHLVDESDSASQIIHLSIPEGKYLSLSLLLGVDSLHNVSGAQTDALDPANDMFWTWNSGYVMAKMEGNSVHLL